MASSTINLNLEHELWVGMPETAGTGDVAVVRVVSEGSLAGQIELTSGRISHINPDDIIAGVLGSRRALKGFMGEAPAGLRPGDSLHILNLGGVIGKCTGQFHEAHQPVDVRLLGLAMRRGHVLNIMSTAIEAVPEIRGSVPIIMVAGTCMSSGKTRVASEIIGQFSRRGYRVAAGKLSGIACLKDTLSMEDHGAVKTLSFLDCGYPSTVGLKNLSSIGRTITGHLNRARPDLIVLELGDGVMGFYQVDSLFLDREIMNFCSVLIFCASDFVGAWGGLHHLRQKGIHIDLISGPVTDTIPGVEYIRNEFGIQAENAVRGGENLYHLVRAKLEEWLKSA